jgi:hypothetical protein
VETDEHEAFRRAVRDSLLQDPTPTLENLARTVGLRVDELVHHALVRWVSAGSEALMVLDSLALDDLVAARRREDWKSVAGIIDWLEVGRAQNQNE